MISILASAVECRMRSAVRWTLPAAAALALATGLPAAQSSSSSLVALVGGTVIDGSANASRRDHTVLIRDGRIVDVVPRKTAAIPRDARGVDPDATRVLLGELGGGVVLGRSTLGRFDAGEAAGHGGVGARDRCRV